MVRTSSNSLDQFHWEVQPAAQAIVNELLGAFLAKCPPAEAFSHRLLRDAGGRFGDWIDHIEVPTSSALVARLRAAGFVRQPSERARECYEHPGAIFPSILVGESARTVVAFKVESVVDFAAANRLPLLSEVEGDELSRLRIARAFTSAEAEMRVIERHGLRGFDPDRSSWDQRIKAVRHLEAFRTRARDLATDAEGFGVANRLADAAIADLGRDWACDLWFQSERDYWQRRNRAARFQKARQDALGLGWANHDHHTYRSSRSGFASLVAFLEKLGFHCRERFYAGAQAGWGAQVLEQPITGITIFADVDMSPEELQGNFAHDGLPERPGHLGTVGVWCGLHGEAFLQAGMHHLECQFDWQALRDQMATIGHIKTMDPFTTFPYLRQAFTEGERWPVNPARIEALLSEKKITAREAEQFRKHGAVGSHLENLERNDGFKGFNQVGVSDIISKTDPRKLAASGA